MINSYVFPKTLSLFPFYCEKPHDQSQLGSKEFIWLISYCPFIGKSRAGNWAQEQNKEP